MQKKLYIVCDRSGRILIGAGEKPGTEYWYRRRVLWFS